MSLGRSSIAAAKLSGHARRTSAVIRISSRAARIDACGEGDDVVEHFAAHVDYNLSARY